MLGVPLDLAYKEGQWKELCNKLAWSLGTTLGVQYYSDHTWARKRALAISSRVLRDLAGLPTAPGTLYAPEEPASGRSGE